MKNILPRIYLLLILVIAIGNHNATAQAPCTTMDSVATPSFIIGTTVDSVQLDTSFFNLCVYLDSGRTITFYVDSANRQLALFKDRLSTDSPYKKLSCLSITDTLYSPMCGSPSCSEDTGTAFINNLCTDCQSTAAGIKYYVPYGGKYILYLSDRNNHKVGGWIKFKAEPFPNDTVIFTQVIEPSACPSAADINIRGIFKTMSYPSSYASNDTVLSHKGFGQDIQRTYWLHLRVDTPLNNIRVSIRGQIPSSVRIALLTDSCDADSILHHIDSTISYPDTVVFSSSPSTQTIIPGQLDTGWYHLTVTVPTQQTDTFIALPNYGNGCGGGTDGYGGIGTKSEPFDVSIDGDPVVVLPISAVKLKLQNHSLLWNIIGDGDIEYFDIMATDIIGNNETKLASVPAQSILNKNIPYSFALNHLGDDYNYYKVNAYSTDGPMVSSNYVASLIPKKIEYYYNPITKQLNINEESAKDLAIYDITGRAINPIFIDHKLVDLSNLNSGIYIIRFNSTILKLNVVH